MVIKSKKTQQNFWKKQLISIIPEKWTSIRHIITKPSKEKKINQKKLAEFIISFIQNEKSTLNNNFGNKN